MRPMRDICARVRVLVRGATLKAERVRGMEVARNMAVILGGGVMGSWNWDVRWG